MICWHGMIDKAFRNLKYGENNLIISPWVCSASDDNTYLHVFEFARDETLDEGEAFDFGVRQARESAIIQAAINADNKIHVIQLDIPDDELEIDYSCSNMEHCRFINSDRFNELFKNDNTQVFEYSFNQALAVFAIAELIDLEQFNKHNIDPCLLSAAEIIKGIDYSRVLEEIYC